MNGGRDALGFERLHALVRGGYRPQLGTATIDNSILLEHRGKGPKLRLYPDGTLQVLDRKFPIHADGASDRFVIDAEDEASYRRFARYLEGLPTRRGKWRRRLFPF